jgi:TonB family protein
MFLSSHQLLNNRTRLLAALFLAVVFHAAFLPFDASWHPVYSPGKSFSRSMTVFMTTMNGSPEKSEQQPHITASETKPETTAVASEPLAEAAAAELHHQPIAPDLIGTRFIQAEKVKQTAELSIEDPVPPVSESETVAGKNETKDRKNEIETMAEPGGNGVQPDSISRSDRDGEGIDPPAAIQMAYPRYNVNTPPKYPGLARKRGEEGTVVLKVLVDLDGMVNTLVVETSSGSGLLDRAAAAAVKQWRFEPGQKNGRPVEMWVMVPVVFELTSQK